MRYLYSNKHWSLNKDYDIDKLLYLMTDRPSRINMYNDFVWENNKNQYHRDYDLPSFIDKTNITLHWDKNNELHRERSKPAIICNYGSEQYYINGDFIKSEKPVK